MPNVPFDSDKDSLIEDLYTLSLIWADRPAEQHLERVWHFLGWEMSKRAKKLYEVHTADNAQQEERRTKVIPISAL
jgi:hypothetical protein